MNLVRAGIFLSVCVSSAAAADVAFERHSAPTGLTAELPGSVERFDKWTDIAKGRVIQLQSTIEEKGPGDSWPRFKAHYFVQAVIADKPYQVDAKLKEMLEESSDAAASHSLISSRQLKPNEMPLAGMRGVETVAQIETMGSDEAQIEVSRNMFLGNKWLSVSVRHYVSDKRWPAARLFKSVSWKADRS